MWIKTKNDDDNKDKDAGWMTMARERRERNDAKQEGDHNDEDKK